MEHISPFLYLVVPQAVKKRFVSFAPIRRNLDKLVSTADIYPLLKALISGNGTGTILDHDLKYRRTCDEAQIPNEFCPEFRREPLQCEISPLYPSVLSYYSDLSDSNRVNGKCPFQPTIAALKDGVLSLDCGSYENGYYWTEPNAKERLYARDLDAGPVTIDSEFVFAECRSKVDEKIHRNLIVHPRRDNQKVSNAKKVISC